MDDSFVLYRLLSMFLNPYHVFSYICCVLKFRQIVEPIGVFFEVFGSCKLPFPVLGLF